MNNFKRLAVSVLLNCSLVFAANAPVIQVIPATTPVANIPTSQAAAIPATGQQPATTLLQPTTQPVITTPTAQAQATTIPAAVPVSAPAPVAQAQATTIPAVPVSAPAPVAQAQATTISAIPTNAPAMTPTTQIITLPTQTAPMTPSAGIPGQQVLATPPPLGNIIEEAKKRSELTSIVEIIQIAGKTEDAAMTTPPAPFTAFFPDNATLAADSRISEALKTKNKDILKPLVKHLVTVGTPLDKQDKDKLIGELESIGGAKHKASDLIPLITGSIKCSNGTIHIINKVLTPTAHK